tara:strand:- start:121 stop:498 length:378 start_codon:yes stop_codon:yes gene_type:complete
MDDIPIELIVFGFISIIIIIILSAVSFYHTWFSTNYKSNVTINKILSIISGTVFLVFVLAISGFGPMLLLIVPVIALIVFLNMKKSNICSGCGRPWMDWILFKRCMYCGAKYSTDNNSDKPDITG